MRVCSLIEDVVVKNNLLYSVLYKLVRFSLGTWEPRSVDIIRCRFKIVIDQHKMHMARVCNLQQNRFRSIKTVVCIVVSVSLLFALLVPTY